jgi:hypothetical protein
MPIFQNNRSCSNNGCGNAQSTQRSSGSRSSADPFESTSLPPRQNYQSQSCGTQKQNHLDVESKFTTQQLIDNGNIFKDKEGNIVFSAKLTGNHINDPINYCFHKDAWGQNQDRNLSSVHNTHQTFAGVEKKGDYKIEANLSLDRQSRAVKLTLQSDISKFRIDVGGKTYILDRAEIEQCLGNKEVAPAAEKQSLSSSAPSESKATTKIPDVPASTLNNTLPIPQPPHTIPVAPITTIPDMTASKANTPSLPTIPEPPTILVNPTLTIPEVPTFNANTSSEANTTNTIDLRTNRELRQVINTRPKNGYNNGGKPHSEGEPFNVVSNNDNTTSSFYAPYQDIGKSNIVLEFNTGEGGRYRELTVIEPGTVNASRWMQAKERNMQDLVSLRGTNVEQTNSRASIIPTPSTDSSSTSKTATETSSAPEYIRPTADYLSADYPPPEPPNPAGITNSLLLINNKIPQIPIIIDSVAEPIDTDVDIKGQSQNPFELKK